MSSGIFLLFGLGILGGILSSSILKQVRAPQVLAYLLAGLVVGQSGFKWITLADIEHLKTFSLFALAIIGLLVGTEIKQADFKRYGKQFMSILLGEGLGAFFLVTIFTGTALYWVVGSWTLAVTGGIVFGAISSATDPASTMNVLWEKKAAGLLTTTITAVIALDDALALLLYGLASGAAQVLAASGSGSIAQEIIHVALEIFGSLLIGFAAGFAASWMVTKTKGTDNNLIVPFGMFLLSIAVSNQLDLDVVITALTMGIIITNRSPHDSKRFVEFIKALAGPVYVMFFLLTGARLTIGSMPGWLWGIVALFVLGRSIGKVSGAYWGAHISKAKQAVKRYTGLGLFSQGGVAIGLAVMAGHHLDNIQLADGMTLGHTIISGIAATTFIIQLIGPAAVSVATKLSNEAGLRITLQDLLESHTVADVMPKEHPPHVLTENATVHDVVNMFSLTNADLLPVVDEENNLQGIVTFESIRQILAEASFWRWSLVVDVMDFEPFGVAPQTILKDAINRARSLGYFQIPVVKDGKLLSILDIRHVENQLKTELLGKQEAVYSD